MKVTVNIANPSKTMSRIFNDKIGVFTAETCVRYFNPYVPMKKGNLSQAVATEPYKITYEMPYAKRIYNGYGLNFSRQFHPQATSEWDKASMAVNRNAIAKTITRFIERG